MDWRIVGIILLGVAGICFLVKAGAWETRDRRSVQSGIRVAFGTLGTLLIAVSIITAVVVGELNSIGKPAELEKDGTYEIRIIDFSEKDLVGVLVLKEEGKTDLIPPLYKKVSTSLFKKDDLANLKLGEIRTIQKRTVALLYQEIIVKQ